MKHLKKFENFENQDLEPTIYDMQTEDEEGINYNRFEEEEEEEDECENEMPQEEILEKKKSKGMPSWLKKDKKSEDKKEEKETKKEEKGGKGLSAKQKKLPEGLRKAIEARKKK